MTFWLLSSWHGCRLQSTGCIVPRAGIAVGCPSPSSLSCSSKPAPQLWSTTGLSKQHGDARRPGNTGGHSGFALIMHASVGAEPRCSLHLPWLCWPANNPPVKYSTGLQASLSTGSVHFIPPSLWLPSLPDGDWGLKQSWGLKQRRYMWILSLSSLCCSSILPVKPFLLPSPARNMRSHGKRIKLTIWLFNFFFRFFFLRKDM